MTIDTQIFEIQQEADGYNLRRELNETANGLLEHNKFLIDAMINGIDPDGHLYNQFRLLMYQIAFNQVTRNREETFRLACDGKRYAENLMNVANLINQTSDKLTIILADVYSTYTFHQLNMFLLHESSPYLITDIVNLSSYDEYLKDSDIVILGYNFYEQAYLNRIVNKLTEMNIPKERILSVTTVGVSGFLNKFVHNISLFNCNNEKIAERVFGLGKPNKNHQYAELDCLMY